MRTNFSSLHTDPPYPHFLDVQVSSFKSFLEIGVSPEKRRLKGMYDIFKKNFPIQDARENYLLEFLDYNVEAPKNTPEECTEQGLTYSIPLRVRFRLSSTDKENEDFQAIEEDIFFGNIPYLTDKGSFIVNGAERVVVSQIHRSPGVFFSQVKHSTGVRLFSARIIPFKGSWIEFQTDANQVMYAYIDRRKKFPVTPLLRAMGFSTDWDILKIFGLAEEVPATKKSLTSVIGRKLAARVLKTWQEDIVLDEETGELETQERTEVVLERGTILQEEYIELILKSGVERVILHKESEDISEYAAIYNTLDKDSTHSMRGAHHYIYREFRGGGSMDVPDEQAASDLIEGLFFNEKRYDLGEVGRYKLNKKLSLKEDESARVLSRNDIVSIIKRVVDLANGKLEVDDIDHLSNRRVRTMGEQLMSHFNIGLTRMVRVVRERMNVRDSEDFKPSDLINVKTLSSVLNTFFGSSQLSQFMDQTNPLAELTHKRRISSLGPGGLSRERAGFEVRDVHYTHYGRLCTIETPEGPNIGLISSLCVHAKVNDMGFIETPYRKVKKGVVTHEVVYLSAEEEDKVYIAQANAPIDENGNFKNPLVKTRYHGDFPLVEPKKIQYMDIGTNQIVSIAASMIPFLEHDDANRALMGSNMQRQAVALMRPQAPIVGTGMEAKVAKDSKGVLVAEEDGEVMSVDARSLVIRYEQTKTEKLVSFHQGDVSYPLIKFRRTNQGTCVNLRPIVLKGQKIKKGQVLTDGFATDQGELALGSNLKVAFMPWRGYNFEDAILISEEVVRQDIFTSIHIDEFELDVRDIKHGREELTAEIPNVSDDAIRNLDDHGIVQVGARIRPGDVLIGKITPKGETDPTPEEKLLRAIFGEKAGDVKNASLKAPPSAGGTVIDTKLFARPKTTREYRQRIKREIEVLKRSYAKNLKDLQDRMVDKLAELLTNQVSLGVKHKFGEVLIKEGIKFTRNRIENGLFSPDADKYADHTERDVPEEANPIADVQLTAWVKAPKKNAWIESLVGNYLQARNEIVRVYKREKFSLEVGDELPVGVIQLAKVYVAKKRKLKVGDKMAGRHGNKGVVAKIVPREDLPFLEDGTPVDVVLNPLGVPSRMNVGQIYETILGWAGYELGKTYASPIFDGATVEEVEAELQKAGLPSLGRTYLYDGLTGARFDQPVTVGIIYMMKLGHLVDDKMHARSIGPYSLITQQPLGGKAQFGGQRFGEMEVWALESFGASNILREILTVKSDDVEGRAKTYESVVKGESFPPSGIPESFNVLMHELRGLGLAIDLEHEEEDP
ncbi:MAG: DNA-directed RNA polymerase subunit beta [Cytophagales bacterium]|nr:DNA-directed RNA polymerase subunit beta [Cytophagales bacterium]